MYYSLSKKDLKYIPVILFLGATAIHMQNIFMILMWLLGFAVLIGAIHEHYTDKEKEKQRLIREANYKKAPCDSSGPSVIY